MQCIMAIFNRVIYFRGSHYAYSTLGSKTYLRHYFYGGIRQKFIDFFINYIFSISWDKCYVSKLFHLCFCRQNFLLFKSVYKLWIGIEGKERIGIEGKERKEESHKSNPAVSLWQKNPTRGLPTLIFFNSKKNASYFTQKTPCYFILESSCPLAF